MCVYTSLLLSEPAGGLEVPRTRDFGPLPTIGTLGPEFDNSKKL